MAGLLKILPYVVSAVLFVLSSGHLMQHADRWKGVRFLSGCLAIALLVLTLVPYFSNNEIAFSDPESHSSQAALHRMCPPTLAKRT